MPEFIALIVLLGVALGLVVVALGLLWRRYIEWRDR